MTPFHFQLLGFQQADMAQQFFSAWSRSRGGVDLPAQLADRVRGNRGLDCSTSQQPGSLAGADGAAPECPLLAGRGDLAPDPAQR